MTGETSKASSLRFADAYVMREELADKQWKDLYWENPITLQELAQPKIAGRKFYWHDPGMRFVRNVERIKRNKTIRPLKRNVKFCEKIFFEQISERQLRQLLTILNISNEYDCKKGYKMGAAKPLGLGSVTVKVKKVVVRNVSLEEDGVSYIEKEYNGIYGFSHAEELGFCKETVELFLRMMSFNAIGRNKLTYPVTERQFNRILNGEPHEKGYEWFVNNYNGGIRERKKSKYKEALGEKKSGTNTAFTVNDPKDRQKPKL